MVEQQGNFVALHEPLRPKWQFPTPFPLRPDTITAAIVEEGIAMLDTHGLKEASDFLLENRLPLDMIERVLTNPAQRRESMS